MYLWDRTKTDYEPNQTKYGGRNFKDITGQKFGRLTPLYPISIKKRVFWICKCDCGNETRTFYSQLNRGITKSCGCYNKERVSEKNSKTKIMFGEIPGSYINQVKYNSNLRNIEYNVSSEYLNNLFISQNRKCSLSGLDIYFGSKYTKCSTTASLDRIDSSIGYIEGNLQWTHKDVNRMKFQKSDLEFYKLCNLIVENCYEKYGGEE